jgi:hypothetical protein
MPTTLVEVAFVEVVEIVVDDVLDRLGEALEDIQVLGKGEALGLQGAFQKIQLAVELHRRYPVQIEGLAKKDQQLVDLVKGGLGDEGKIDFIDEILEKHIDQGLDTEGQSEGIEFHFAIAAVHGGDVHGDMPLLVDILLDFVLPVRQNDPFQQPQVFQQHFQFALQIRLGQGLLELLTRSGKLLDLS